MSERQSETSRVQKKLGLELLTAWHEGSEEDEFELLIGQARRQVLDGKGADTILGLTQIAGILLLWNETTSGRTTEQLLQDLGQSIENA